MYTHAAPRSDRAARSYAGAPGAGAGPLATLTTSSGGGCAARGEPGGSWDGGGVPDTARAAIDRSTARR